ncbi:uracil-DNA glycosylase family protein [Sorangium sp. So ce1024]|uniref:uracil-DNA glycosylase n=1 Tax=unclassified Sorangium TaxID=2621164 RepID=UPI003F00DCC1
MIEALREELADLTASVRAFLEWHAATGADGLPGHPSALHGALGASTEGTPPAARRADRGFAGLDAPPAAASRGASGGAPHVEQRAAAPQPEQRAGFAPPPEQRAAAPQLDQRAAFAPPQPEQRAGFTPPQPEQRAGFTPPHAGQRAAFAPPPEQRSAEAQAPRSPEPAARPGVGAAAAPRAEPAARALASQPEPPEERVARLSLIAEEVRVCQKCPLHAGRTHTVFSRGNPLSEIVFVGEGPGAEEDLQGEPFVGPAGQLLDRMIAAMGYHRDDVYICNIVKCRPPKNRKPEPAEMAACSPYLTSQLALIKPKVIVALGATAVQGLIGTTEGITKLRGTWKLYKGSIPIMPTFHPAYLLRQPSAKREVWSDLKEVMRHLGKSAPDRG